MTIESVIHTKTTLPAMKKGDMPEDMLIQPESHWGRPYVSWIEEETLVWAQ